MKQYRSIGESTLIAAYKTACYPYVPLCSSQISARLNKLAFKFQKLRKRDLDITKKYYCYVYLDPRYPATYKDQYKYILPSGKVVCFAHKPFLCR